ncbi:hypothetical protein AK88_04165 [Plasmodium fragile]|uniref:Uncharacterized protein n=1 Tax=Plasmodium fragile TaxID=5857 RepID=A0A0D9QGR5_PLAFR|nr:uncharacterized protein AK88_04165 [Plasmodium fragile]KJP86194.1 hypothetical protein AK88_04165 [Plasmodium fragile]
MWPLRRVDPCRGSRRTFSNTGEYSSSISRIFNKLNQQLNEELNERCPKGGGGDNPLEGHKWPRNSGGLPPDAIVKQFEGAITKMDLSRMLGRDLSYCMNIVAKMDYFRGHPFWVKACNRLVKGHMLHRINTQSYFIMANSLSKVDLLFGGDVQQRHAHTSDRLNAEGAGSPLRCSSPFQFISYDGDVTVQRKDRTDGRSYHQVYNEIAIRFLLNLEFMNLNSISCVLNMFAKLSLREYNLLGYYLADYIVLGQLRRVIGEGSSALGGTQSYSNGGTSTMLSNVRSSSNASEGKSLLHVDRYSVSKLVIILHALAKLGVAHVEFVSLCCFVLREHLMVLNGLDICNLMYSFSKMISLWSGRKKYDRVSLLRRVTSQAFQSYLHSVMKSTEVYTPRYGSTNGVHNTYDSLLRNNVEGQLKQLYSQVEGEVVKLATQIGSLVKREHVLGKFTAVQISSLALSLGKLELNFYGTFYAMNRKVHHLWKDFSLQSIADFLFGMNEKNISDEQVTLLLCYQFVRLVYTKYCSSSFMNKQDTFSQNHLNVVRQNRENIYFFEKTHKRVHFLDAKDCSLVVRIFQSLSKSEVLVGGGAVAFANPPGVCFPYDVCALGGRSGKLNGSSNDHRGDKLICSPHGHTGEDPRSYAEDVENTPWKKLNEYPNGANATFSSFEASAHLIRFHTIRTLHHVINQHVDLLPFESKCMLCYFSLHVLDFMFPMGGYAQLDGYPFGASVPPNGSSFHLYRSGRMKVPKFPERSILSHISRSLFARLLFHVWESMDHNSLSEVTMRQIHICILSFYLDVMRLPPTGWAHPCVDTRHRGDAHAACPPDEMPSSICVTSSEGISTNISLEKNFPVKCGDDIFLYFSKGNLNKLNAFLDFARVRSFQQKEMTLTSRTHAEVYNCLQSVIDDLNGSGQRRLLHSSEDCVLEPEECEGRKHALTT